MYERLHKTNRKKYFSIVELTETNAKKIMNLNKSRKTGTAKTAILGIIPRRDTFNQKAQKVN